jgi:hypothetical protein
MTVTFVPPRTLIPASQPTTAVVPGNIYSSEMQDDDQEEDLYEDTEMSGLDKQGGGSLLTRKLVVPGQLVTDDPQFMRYSRWNELSTIGDMGHMLVRMKRS